MFPDFPDQLRNSIPIAITSRLVEQLYVAHRFGLFSLHILAMQRLRGGLLVCIAYTHFAKNGNC
jgi:hypothetical protein